MTSSFVRVSNVVSGQTMLPLSRSCMELGILLIVWTLCSIAQGQCSRALLAVTVSLKSSLPTRAGSRRMHPVFKIRIAPSA